jgi:hypothetical protein
MDEGMSTVGLRPPFDHPAEAVAEKPMFRESALREWPVSRRVNRTGEGDD